MYAWNNQRNCLALGLARHSTSKTSNGLEMLKKRASKEGTEEGIKVFKLSVDDNILLKQVSLSTFLTLLVQMLSKTTHY